MAMSGLELAFDLSKAEFSVNQNFRSWYNNYRQMSTCSSTTSSNNYDVGLQYIPGELGGYQAILKKENSHMLSVAMLAFSSSESERSLSRSSDTSGISSMTSGSYMEVASMKLRYQHVETGPVVYNNRNILDVGNNIRGTSYFFTPAAYTEVQETQYYGETYNSSRSNDDVYATQAIIVCPQCGFEIPLEFVTGKCC